MSRCGGLELLLGGFGDDALQSFRLSLRFDDVILVCRVGIGEASVAAGVLEQPLGLILHRVRMIWTETGHGMHTSS
jgi:hypothetical protein